MQHQSLEFTGNRAAEEAIMAWVKTFNENEAAGRLAEVYAELKKSPLAGGRVPNIMKCMGLRPDALMGVWRLNMAITFGASTLGRRREEMIATAVSALNHCHY
jgi:alkylhydroperoxidase family enzyme